MISLCVFCLLFLLSDCQIINPIIPGTSNGGQLTSSQCHLKPADIIFVLDDSGSVGYNNFKKELHFVQAFAKEFDIGPLNVQIGVVTYSSSVHEYIRLNSNRNEQSLINNIMRLPYQSGLTRTADAINLTMYAGFSQPHGDRDSVTDVMMVITDGQSQEPRATANAAQRAHNAGIKTFAIGVGDRVKPQEMDNIASDKSHVFHVSNYDALQQLKEELRNKTCEAIAYSNLYCQNNIKNCNSYGHVVCVNYAQWGRQNCPLYCGYCAAQGTPPPPITITTTTTTTTTTKAPTPPPLLTIGVCEDKFGNCNGYGSSVCTAYRDWSIQNCAHFCQFCHGPATPPPLTVSSTAAFATPAPPCVDKLNNCAAYGSNSCQFYKQWAELNCAKTCGVCGNGIPTPTLPPPTTPMPTTTTPATTTFKGECIDHLHTGSCENYGPDMCFKYREWAYKQCPKFCLFCQPPTTSPPCVDVDPDCESRGPGVCYNNRTWAEKNCRVFCTFCTPTTTQKTSPAFSHTAFPTFSSVQSTSTVPPTEPPTTIPITTPATVRTTPATVPTSFPTLPSSPPTEPTTPPTEPTTTPTEPTTPFVEPTTPEPTRTTRVPSTNPTIIVIGKK